MGLKRTTGRAGFFHALAHCSRAGLTLDHSLYQWAKQLPRHNRGPVQRLAQQVQGGQTLADAGLETGVLLPWEARLLALGSVHGRLDRVLEDLATYHEQATGWWRRLRMRLLFPGGILILGFLALPLPGLFAGQLSVQTYLLQNLMLLAILGLLWTFPGTRRNRHPLSDLVLRCRTLGKPLWQYQRYRFLHQLASLYNAGVPMLDALPIAVGSCDSPLLRRRWSMIETAVRQGSGISEALYRHGALDDTGYALLLGGKAAGRPGKMLEHETHRLAQHISLWQDGLLDWLPRLAYPVVLLLLFHFH